MQDKSSVILVIDDDPAMADFLAFLLNDKGQIISATSGESGLGRARVSRPDLILLDVSMEGMDGFEVCRQLKADPVTSSIPVLFVTAGDDEEIEVQALELGAADFIVKPLRPAIVRARVETQLALRKHIVAMEQLANVDGLTQLYNRRYFDQTLEVEMARHRRQKQFLALALIDVDHFKHYNDALGHQCGDDCLREIGKLLSACTRRPGEMAARYGGEEFIVIIPDCSPGAAVHYGERLCAKVAQLALSHPSSRHGVVTVSLGVVSVIPDSVITARTLLEAADQALYQAKNQGRNRCILAEMPVPPM
ncbi:MULTISPECIES: diguanylate cyclase domain-containing protein [unclassified Duganella]|uniref:diguanylate cyclase domain-containing protein n=1 Tax=unclassified Duganella TaxID=2636909 RepID=UPI00143923C1|nr:MULTISPECIES: diguanylate cyclase [unclassified Duganella]